MTRRRVALPGRSRRPSWMARHRVAGPVLVLAAISTLAAAGVGAAAQASSHPTRPRAAAVAHVTASKHTVSHTAVTHTAGTHTAGTQAAANQICGTRVAGSVRVTHVIWIVMENRSYNQVMPAPYISSLASQCGVATNYHNVSHPSLPNYIAMTSGRSGAQLPATDCPTFCPVSGPSIFSETSSWGVYAESMPGNCVRHDVRPYVAHHTAAPYYSALSSCAARDRPLTSLNLFEKVPSLTWGHYQVIIRGKGNCQERLPLPVDVGEAIATYLRQHRPPCTTRRVFIRCKAPHLGFSTPSSISQRNVSVIPTVL